MSTRNLNLYVQNQTQKPERIAKIIARSGFCSRRDAEKIIISGRVTVNGEKILSPALNLTDEIIAIDGKPINKKQASKLYIYHKPVGLVTSHKDEQGRATVFDELPRDLPRVISVGRLDLNSEGLLLLTNDGELARKLELPSSNLERVYRVRVYGALPDFSGLQNGITIDGVRYDKLDVAVEKKGANSWLKVRIWEGKNREIRRVMAHLGLEVNRLIRISYGQYELGDLQIGEVQEVRINSSPS